MIQFILEGNTAEKYRDSRSVTFNVQGSLFRAVFLEIVIEVQISESLDFLSEILRVWFECIEISKKTIVGVT
ncbi:hypothetical protein [Idiomarina sp.]|uniref:hypothetical protein n=1 Tax=Idiomarina sp. TaxID=1874361 RepID=UPI002608C8DD|nr:hypothetical protein [Idiomarina sp.]